jgi:hypothetical protein
MQRRALRWGHGRPFFMDTTFGIAHYKFPFLTILVMNNECHGVSVCWAFLPNEKEATIAGVLRAFKTELVELDLVALPPQLRLCRVHARCTWAAAYGGRYRQRG